MSTSIAQFDIAALDAAIAEFGPARVVVSGKTTTEKRISVVNQGSTAVRLFAAEMKGKVGMAARSGLQNQGLSLIASQARRGNYKPLAEALGLILAESVTITNRASFESLRDRYTGKAEDMVNAGKDYNKAGKLTSAYSNMLQALSLIDATYEGVAAIIAQEKGGEDE